MNNNKMKDIFSPNPPKTKQSNKANIFQISDKNDENNLSFNQDRINNKLSLRKKKIEEILSSKRNINIINTFQVFNDSNDNLDFISSEHEIIPYSKNDFTTGDLYVKLKTYYESKDIDKIREVVNNLVNFFNVKKLDNIELKEYYMKSGCNINNKEKFPFAKLLFDIGANTEEKKIFIYCFNFILNFSFISNEFCKELIQEKKIDLILDKLIYFYPIFKDETNSIENIETDNTKIKSDATRTESYYFGLQIFRLLGNIYISAENFEQFEMINFYDKIFYLISDFNLEEINLKHKRIFYEYLETLLWLIGLFVQNDENFIKNYQDKLLGIIPYFFNNIKMLYFTQEIDLLDRILEILEILSATNYDFAAQIVDAQGIQILTNLFGYLFSYNKESIEEITLNSEAICKILNIFINIFCLESKYLEYFDDYSSFALVIEKLISLYKLHAKNHFEIQIKLVKLMANLACFSDIEPIITKFITNRNIIKDLFKYYNSFHKKDIILFIDNIIEIQPKKVIDFILDSGGFDIIKNNICNFNDNNTELVKNSIIAFYKLIQKEKGFNIRLFFEKIYNTAIPEKIKEIALNINVDENNDENEYENKIKNILYDFEVYENSLNYD